ncbi:MAG: DUF839 domain-containing protein [Hyphomonadaceae bacterium]|nr:DUF839 domain-containing protein [Hyphomonadaceae bacterium]
MHTRRSFIQHSGGLLAVVSAGMATACTKSLAPPPTSPPVTTGISQLDDIGPLLEADPNGVRLPVGFTSRIVARSGEAPTPQSDYIWHDAPDGGAVFELANNGWVYVSNSEVSRRSGGVGALVFDAHANVVDAYSILSDTTSNCAGGAMPWGSWMSCEEFSDGQVWECDPLNSKAAQVYPQLGSFAHEAVAYDTDTDILYMTEDRRDGGLYRFVPDQLTADGFADFSAGQLQIAVVNPADYSIDWQLVPDPLARTTPTRKQVVSATRFNGGEGIVYFGGKVIFATKGDNVIWSYDTVSNALSTLYEFASSPSPVLSGVDNIGLTLDGEPIISEDGGDLQIVALTKSGKVAPIVQLIGHDRSEIAGPAFSPDGKKLYFSSQRGTTGRSRDGLIFEISGPFHT